MQVTRSGKCSQWLYSQVRWHEGLVIRYQVSTTDGRARRGGGERYQIAYSDGMCEWIDGLPEPGISFRKPGPDARVTAAVLASAQQAHQVG